MAPRHISRHLTALAGLDDAKGMLEGRAGAAVCGRQLRIHCIRFWMQTVETRRRKPRRSNQIVCIMRLAKKQWNWPKLTLQRWRKKETLEVSVLNSDPAEICSWRWSSAYAAPHACQCCWSLKEDAKLSGMALHWQEHGLVARLPAMILA